MIDSFKQFIEVNGEVAAALALGQPVVALESTIISHGMPYPQNVETALRVEQIVREHGAVPATIAIIKGKIKVGLSEAEVSYLGQAENVIKTSRRDLPLIIAKGLDGATTVASTMIIADMAGIRVFVTGGIGGVHRGAPETFDVSADLTELARTDVAVICAGCKSILDIGLTLEYLETHGVPVIGYQTDDFPAFYTRASGFGVDYRLDTPRDVAKAIRTKWDLGLRGGLVVANPILREHELPLDLLAGIVEAAVQEAHKQGIRGKEITPFLLAQVKEMTGGRSLVANIELIYHNARVGAHLASALASL
ncbi:MAG: pseudouridine-5'-phosphate glycosidase [Peptococcaceae bacterium]|nr:pseudouridine-5'-phosphate glycosidase [Peptococcaceae bacterium]